jgi:hypothetical protein
VNGADVWAPLGTAGTVPAVDDLTPKEWFTTPLAVPRQHRCDLDLPGLRVDLSWREGRVLAMSVPGPHGELREVAHAERMTIDHFGQDMILWTYESMRFIVGDDVLDVARERSGRDRWAFRMSAPDGRGWTWRPAGRVLADRMELTRDGETTPVVVQTIRPVRGHPRSAAGPSTVTWQASAAPIEVAASVMWMLERNHFGLLPKVQRVVVGDIG